MVHLVQKLCAVCVVTILLAACEPIVDNRGHSMENVDFKQIVVGQSGPEDVQSLLGSPTSRSSFGQEVWYYITEKKETTGAFAPKVTDQQVTAVYFDGNRLVEKIETHTKDEGKDVQFVREETPTEGHHMTVFEQLLGNFGRFGAPGKSINPRDLGR